MQCVTIKNQNLFKSKKLYVIIVSHMSFRVNPHSVVGLNVKDIQDFLLEAGTMSEVKVTAMGFEPTIT